MNDKVCNVITGEVGTFSTYFVVGRGKMFETRNFYYEDKLKNCFYVKKYGSNINPVIYVDTKVNNKWISKNCVIGGYREFVNFVINNLDSYICLRGFSRVDYSHLVMIILNFGKPNVRLEKTGIKTNKTKKKVNSKFKRKQME